MGLCRYLEASARGKTSAAITKLMTLTPASAVLVTLDKAGDVASEQDVPTALIHRNDVLKVCDPLRGPCEGAPVGSLCVPFLQPADILTLEGACIAGMLRLMLLER